METNIVLKDLRKKRGLTQAQIANGVGLSQKEISLIESGHQNPKSSLIGKLIHSIVELSGMPLDGKEWLSIIHSHISLSLSELFSSEEVPIKDVYTEGKSSVTVTTPNNITVKVKIKIK